ncbi:unnamed protein product [Closterium sp. NIES-54]
MPLKPPTQNLMTSNRLSSKRVLWHNKSGGAEPRGTATSGGPAGASPRLSPWPEPHSPQQLREWFTQPTHLRSGAARAGDSAAGDTRAGGAGVTAGARGTGGAAAADPRGAGGAGAGGAGAGGAGAGGTGAGGTGAGGARAIDPGAGGTGAGGAGGSSAGGTVRPRPYFVPLHQQPASPLPAPSPYTEQTGGLTEHREPASHLALPVRTSPHVPRPRLPPVPDVM